MTRISEHLELHKEEYKPWLVDNEQGRIDIKILPYLQDIEKGFFVEAGALDGLFMSNTKLLEDLGWSGILIEPSKKAFDKCVKNRKCIVGHGALVSKNHKEVWVYGDFFYDGDKGEGAWSSINRNKYVLNEKIRVPAVTLDEVLEFYKIKKVDFLSLDVEGYELNVLKGIDFTTTEVTYILMEVNIDMYDLEDIDEYLGRFGYSKRLNLSNFTKENSPHWDGSHQDYLYTK